MYSFSERLNQAIQTKNSALVVGLDPIPDRFPVWLKSDAKSPSAIAESILSFNKLVIDAVAEHAVAVKPQSAYYEIYGSAGIQALEHTLSYARTKGLLAILDGKRNDIGSTSDAYANAYFGHGPLSSDALTINPYLGSDGLLPFVTKALQNGRGLFVLIKTSNPSSGELQDLPLADGRPVYVRMAHLLQELIVGHDANADYSCIGAVTGATYPAFGSEIRTLLPKSILLVPGYGEQGAGADMLAGFFNADGLGAVVNSARGIIYAFSKKAPDCTPEEFKAITRHAAETSQAEINSARNQRV